MNTTIPNPASVVIKAPALRVSDLSKSYNSGGGRRSRSASKRLMALDGVDLTLARGEILALVGESGSGKSTLANILVGSLEPTSGTVEHNGHELPPGRNQEVMRQVQMVFQDPYSSLNPRLTVGAMLAELLLVHRIVARQDVRAESIRLLGLVGMEEDALSAYPAQFSGGQRQRIAIARALAVRPDILIADEPVSALDVSVQATILDLFASLRNELGLSILFIAHNLAVVQHISQRVAVMYLGRIVEIGETQDVFNNPKHPYTRALIDSIPRMTSGSINNDVVLKGEPPSPVNLPSGCRFHPRCAFATDLCRQVDPHLQETSPGHASACIRMEEIPPRTVRRKD